MAYDVRSFAKLGLLHRLIGAADAAHPSAADVERVRAELIAAVADARAGPTDLATRLTSPAALTGRAASMAVRRRLAEQWDAS
jgi:malonate decarboxylase gamma subunit